MPSTPQQNPEGVTLDLEIPPQPDDTSCGPTCLHAVYRYYGDTISLEEVAREVPMVEGGGTLAVMLGLHALRRGYRAVLYTYNLRVFDPTWFNPMVPDFDHRLQAQLAIRPGKKIKQVIRGYTSFRKLGGEIRMEDLRGHLIRRHLRRRHPILTGLSATFLYRSPRERFGTTIDDDLRGEPAGHFVLLSGYDAVTREVRVADPYPLNPSAQHYYSVDMDRLINAILLGVFSYDGNLLVIQPKP